MKVCVIGLRGIPDVMGGVETHCQQLLPRIHKLEPDFDIKVLARQPYVPAKHSVYEGIEVTALPAFKNKYLETILHSVCAIFYARFRERAELLHIHAVGSGLLAPLARALGLRVVLTHHGQDYKRSKWNRVASFFLRLGESLAIKAAHRIIVVGKSVAAGLQQDNPAQASKISYVPNGVMLETQNKSAGVAIADEEALLAKWNLKRGEYIVTVGRIDPAKGFQDLIAAHARHNTGLKLVIIGDAIHDDSFSRDLLNQGSEEVVFTGFQQGQALYTLFRGAGLFVLPSYHEGLSIVTLEAISFDLPVVLSDIPANLDIGLPELCYFRTADVDDLAAKLAVPDPGVYTYNREELLAKYAWDSIALQTAALYREALL